MPYYKYYSVLRPVSIGTYPKEGMTKFENFDKRTYIDAIKHEAWGFLIYNRELSEQEARSFDLVRSAALPRQIAATIKYNKTHTKQINLTLNLVTDEDILNKLDAVSNKRKYILDLIRADIQRSAERS